MASSQSQSQSQSDSKVFSVRIVTVDYYMAPPIPNVDICYSTFQGEKVNEVPVIRVYGPTPSGQKACVHIHKALPYLYVPCADIPLQSEKGGDACARAIFLALERSLKLKGTAASKRQHVHGCSLVRGRRFYGYHPEEELFVKIYLYHPSDVSRAANLLLAGEVMERSLQPYESHIPYILQFFVDYNLHGMGYLHLLKMKFRHPVPEKFTSNSCGDAHLGSTAWLSSSIPPQWIWEFPGENDASLGEEFFSVKRQSVCELEGDTMIEEILNQQFKMYTSLSQSQSDVKMVQSLIPIWEEEYERTGMHVAAVPPDPGKPLPEDVLKSLSPDLELINKFMELSRESERCLTPHDETASHARQAATLIDEVELHQLGRGDSIHLHGEYSRKIKEEISIGPIPTDSAQVSKHDVEGDAVSNTEEGVCLKSLSNDGLESMQVIGTANTKSADMEALGLLRWLATSEAAEEIHSDDDLAHEIILSPLLPAKSMDKVLEKASIDYESESQKECQDILDSIKDSVDLESMESRASQSSDHTHMQRQSEKSIPRLDGYCDDLNSTPIAGEYSSEAEMKTERKLKSLYEGQHSASTGFYSKSKKPLWGSIPFSLTQNVSGFRSINTDSNARGNNDGKDQVGKSCSGGNIVGDCSNTYMRDIDSNSKQDGGLVRCSVRDLMRKKRYHQVEPSDSDIAIVKKIKIGEEKIDVHMSNSFDNDRRRMVLPESLEPGTLSAGSEAKNPGVCDVRPACYDVVTHCQLPRQSNKDSIFNSTTDRVRGREYDTKLDYPLSNEGTSASTNGPKTQLALVPLDKESLQQDFELKREDHTFPCSQFDLCHDIVPNSVIAPQITAHMTNPEAGLDVCSMEFGSRNNNLGKQRLHEISSDDASRTDLSIDIFTVHNETCHGGEKSGGSLSKARRQRSLVVNKDIEFSDLIGLTLCKKPPIINWKAGRSESALLLRTSEKYKELSEKEFDNIPLFFGGDCQDNGDWNKCFEGNDGKVFQGSDWGVPTHYQNDGSCLYLLTHVLSPPSVDSVTRWLLQDNIGCGNLVKKVADDVEAPVKSSYPKSSESNPVDSPSSLPDDYHKDLAEAGLVPFERNAFDCAHKEDGENHHFERRPLCMNVSEVVHSMKDVTKVNTCTDALQDISQISGPEGILSNTPLSQLGFRDPANVGCGQQLTMLSIEVIAESRGDLRPDPRFDAINIISLAIQHDDDTTAELYVLLRGYSESDNRYIDGLPGCRMFVFSEEKLLFCHFVKIMHSFDPDIIMGWDIQGASLGFLAERASHLGIGLLNKISRTPVETKLMTGGSGSPEYGIPDILQQESLISDTGQIQDSIIEDEWGRTHASGIHVGGRIVLNIWRLVRGEVKLRMYTAEAVAEAVLRRKVPLIPPKVLTRWYSSGPARARYRCIEYVLERVRLNLEIVIQLDMINRTSELARVFGIEFFSVLSRGSQYRVESMFLRLAHAQNYLAISPGNQQVASQPAMECIPLVMEPESGFYSDPVIVLDFQSLYPSIIIAYNLCYCTCLGKVLPAKPNTVGVCSYSPNPHVLQKLKDQILLTPNGVMYVPSKVRRGVLPRLLEEILSTRIMVKQAMKKLAPLQQVLQKIFNARQLALKLIANVTYGYTAAGFSGRMPCAELADSIVQCGRSTLEKAISFVNSHDKWKARVIYGDTDSMFVLLKGRSVMESFDIGKEIASAITAMNPDPVTLKFEKVYHPCFLLTKKRYVGYSYESPEQYEPIFNAKGIETVRRDTCEAVSKMMEQSLRLFFEQQDLLKVKAYLHRQWTRILSGRMSLQDFVFAKEVRLGTYSTRSSSSLPPAAIVATKTMRTDPRAEPCYAERVPYVVIHGEPGARLVDMVVDPLDLLVIGSPYRLNDNYYITKQIIPALQRVFGLLGADLNQWFSDMPRPVREAFSKRPFSAHNSHRTRIDYYYLSKHCILCGELVQASEHICAKCSVNEIGVTAAVVGRTSNLERDLQHLNAICRHCGGGDWLVESGVKCKSLACSVLYERCKVQKELQSISAVAAEKGFYPKCNVEWF